MSSCNHRKYQGALAGFGATAGLAGASKGILMKTARMMVTNVVMRVTHNILFKRFGELSINPSSSILDEVRTLTSTPLAMPSKE